MGSSRWWDYWRIVQAVVHWALLLLASEVNYVYNEAAPRHLLGRIEVLHAVYLGWALTELVVSLVPRKNRIKMEFVLHHAVTAALLLTAMRAGMMERGAVVIKAHIIAEPIVDFYYLAKWALPMPLRAVSEALLVFRFIQTRAWDMVWAVTLPAYEIAREGHFETGSVAIFAGLAVLQCLQWFWSLLILRGVARKFTRQ